jgi:hypothetical protein
MFDVHVLQSAPKLKRKKILFIGNLITRHVHQHDFTVVVDDFVTSLYHPLESMGHGFTMESLWHACSRLGPLQKVPPLYSSAGDFLFCISRRSSLPTTTGIRDVACFTKEIHTYVNAPAPNIGSDCTAAILSHGMFSLSMLNKNTPSFVL